MRFFRKYRTLLLGAVAMAVLIGAAVYSFDIEWRTIGQLLLMCLLMLLCIIALAALTVGSYVWVRKQLDKS